MITQYTETIEWTLKRVSNHCLGKGNMQYQACCQSHTKKTAAHVEVCLSYSYHIG